MTPTRKMGLGALVLGSALVGGIGLATMGSASAAAPATPAAVTIAGSTDTDPSTDTVDATAADDRPIGPHSANGVTEEVLTGDAAAGVQAAVAAAHPDATIDRMETDAEGSAYEAHITLADGTKATVKLDAAFAITATETGRPGGRRGGGGDCGPRSADGDTAAAPADAPTETSAAS